jgi:cytochrome c oxidase assembly protein subunit 15
MVKSGLEDRVSVAPERLATHLGLALILLAGLVWTALEAWNGPRPAGRPRPWSGFVAALLALAFVQCLLGALLAGSHGGLVDADWPLMAGRLIPSDYWQGGLWQSLAHGQAASQFDHRLGAYLLFFGTIAAALTAPRGARGLAALVGVAVTAQAALGVATLRTGDPLALAIVHQAGAAAVLILIVILLWRARRLPA